MNQSAHTAAIHVKIINAITIGINHGNLSGYQQAEGITNFMKKPPSKKQIKKAWIVWQKDSINVSADTLAILYFYLFEEWPKWN